MSKKHDYWRKRKLRDAALIAQGGLCFYCKKELSYLKATADHVLPKSRGGQDVPGNIVACCKACNEVKAAKDLFSFLMDNFLAVKKEGLIQLPPCELCSLSKKASQTQKAGQRARNRLRKILPQHLWAQYGAQYRVPGSKQCSEVM